MLSLATEPELKALRLSDVDDLRVLGTTSFRVPGETLRLDLGQVFVADPINGTVLIRNETSEQIEVKGISTSCGCTAAYPATRIITDGGTSKLLVKANIGKPGRSGVQLRVKTNLGEFVIVLALDARPRIDLDQSSFKVSHSEQIATVLLSVNDDRIDPSAISVLVNGESFSQVNLRGRRLLLHLPFEQAVAAQIMHVTLMLGKKNLAEFQLPVPAPPNPELVSRSIFAARDGHETTFRLLVRGAGDGVEPLPKVYVEIASHRVLVSSQHKKYGGIHMVTCAMPYEKLNDQTGALLWGDRELLFSISTGD